MPAAESQLAAVRPLLDQAVEHLPTNAFAFVMASAITSTALGEAGAGVLSAILLVVAAAGFVALLAVAVAHLVRYPAAVVRDAQNPRTSFGYFTLVASLGVLAGRLTTADASWAAVPMAVVAVPLWVLLTYVLPATLILRPHKEPVASLLDGSWLLWVVGTQSLSIVVSVVDIGLGDAAPTVAIALWGIGIVLYLILTTLVMLRLLSVPNSPETMTPSYWILSGATAVSVLAAAHILALPKSAPALAATRSFVSGSAFVLWAFGTWWIPLLVLFGVWRYGVKRRALRYETGLWSVVFPLGMYATASMKIGDVLDIALVERIGRAATVVAVAAWVAAGVSMVLTASRRLRNT